MSAFARALGGRLQRTASTLAGKPFFWLAFIVTLFTWPISRSLRAVRDLPREQRPVLGLVRDFTVREPSGGELDAAELHGRVWLASFSASDREPTHLESQRTLTRMAEVRHRTRNLGDAFRLVTFTVAPDRELSAEPSVLSADHRSRGGSWRFVSAERASMRDILHDFQVGDGARPGRVALVDGAMRIRGYYDLADEDGVDVLLRDVSRLLSLGG